MKLIILMAAALLTGCAGVTQYEIETPDGVKVIVKNTKDYDSYTLNARKEADGSYSVELRERGISASDPLRASLDANKALLDRLMKFVPVPLL
jgi:hypothetical protein